MDEGNDIFRVGEKHEKEEEHRFLNTSKRNLSIELKVDMRNEQKAKNSENPDQNPRD